MLSGRIETGASIARLRALLEHLEDAATKPNPYDWLATTPTPGQKNPRKVTPWWEEDFAEMADRKITAALQGTVTGKHEPEPELRDTPYPGQDEKRIAERPRRPSPRTEVVLDGDASARLNTRGMT